MLRKFGYKATFMLGLTLYGVGALMFWPAGIERSFGVCLSAPKHPSGQANTRRVSAAQPS